MTATSVTAITAAPATARLNRTEAGLLQAAAADAGRLTCPAAMKPTTHARLLGRFLRDGLVIAPATADGPHRLTPGGYRAIGLAPPKRPRAANVSAAAPTAAPAGIEGAAGASKKAQVQALLARKQGATLAELIAATGWLPQRGRGAARSASLACCVHLAIGTGGRNPQRRRTRRDPPREGDGPP